MRLRPPPITDGERDEPSTPEIVPGLPGATGIDGLLDAALDPVVTMGARGGVEAERVREALTDPLAGLPNRTLLVDRPEWAPAAAQIAAPEFVAFEEPRAVGVDFARGCLLGRPAPADRRAIAAGALALGG